MIEKLKKRPPIGVTLAIISLFLDYPCHAQVSGIKTMQACALAVRGMDGNPPTTVEDLTHATSCMGMVEGIVGTLVILEMSAKQRHSSLVDTACFPESFSTAQAIRISFKYMQDHPDQLHEPGSGLIYLALTKAFPCAHP